jgi:uncharacterized damage-inducible protein DinB
VYAVPEVQVTTSENLLAEFDEEMASTRRILECVPDDKFAWKPHEKSFTLGKLANHLTVLPALAAIVINGQGTRPSEVTSRADLLASFEKNIAAAREALGSASEDDLGKSINVTPTLAKPLTAILRGKVMNHLIHHRGQLSVYLRLLDIAVPGMYGPSADEKS